MKDDGTLEGTVSVTRHGNLTYTAERLKERKSIEDWGIGDLVIALAIGD